MTKKVQMKWRLSQDLTGNEMRVYQYLREGKKNRRTREFLVQKTGLDDRAVRAAVHGMRQKGFPICSITGKPGGYWFCTDEEELKSFIADLEIQRDCFSNAIRKLRTLLRDVQDGKLLF